MCSGADADARPAGVTGWGIIGTGNIATKFAACLQHVPGAALVAVGSRSQAKADAFGEEFGVPVAGRYRNLEQQLQTAAADTLFFFFENPKLASPYLPSYGDALWHRFDCETAIFGSFCYWRWIRE